MEQLAGKPGKSAWPPTRAAELLHSWKGVRKSQACRSGEPAPWSKGWWTVDWRDQMADSTELHIHRDILLNILQVQEIVFILDLYF